MFGSLFKSAITAVDTWAATELPGGKPNIDYTVTHPVPGLKKALDYVPTPEDPLYVGKPLATGVLQTDIERGSTNGALLPLTTVRERTMLQYMCSITDKPNWHKKIFDARIVYKWRLESAKEIEAGTMPMLTNPMFEYCIAELQHIARHVYPNRKDGALVVFSGNVVRSDEAISRLAKRNLQLAVKPLEHIPKPERDWRPGSKKTVLDLVQPSLFPLVYGTSKVLDVGQKAATLDDCVMRCGEGKQYKTKELPPTTRGDVAEAYSTAFQWLPCEVDISGDEAKIISYINNVHPKKHADLYAAIEKVIDAAIPLWELSLAPLYDPSFQHFRRITIDKVEYNVDAVVQGGQVPLEIPKPPTEHGTDGLSSIFRNSWRSSMPGDLNDDPEAAWDKQNPRRPDSRDASEYDIMDDVDDDNEGSHVDSRDGDYASGEEYLEDDDGIDDDEGLPTVIQPEPKPFNAHNHTVPRPINFKRLYGRRGRPLQIIVELHNIELTPRRQKYPGRIWQLQGKANEHIVATALYDYSSSNITPSRIGFRQFVDADSANEIDYEQDEYRFLRELFGCHNGAAAVQNVGTVEAREGRLLTFPNILQYQMQPFKLVDPRRKGHRKILALYLVDPNIRIISTANVPCQQMEWWRETIPVPEPTTVEMANRRDSVMSTASKASTRGDVRGKSAIRATWEKGLAKLPSQIKDHVFDQVDGFPVTMLDAKNIRDDLIKERQKFMLNHQKEFLNSNAFALHEAANDPIRDYDSN